MSVVGCCSDPNQSPGERSLGEWPLHTPTSREYLELNSRFIGRQPDRSRAAAVGRGPLLAECAFWGIYLPQLVERTGLPSLAFSSNQTLNDNVELIPKSHNINGVSRGWTWMDMNVPFLPVDVSVLGAGSQKIQLISLTKPQKVISKGYFNILKLLSQTLHLVKGRPFRPHTPCCYLRFATRLRLLLTPLGTILHEVCR